jgi:hypothetical protein
MRTPRSEGNKTSAQVAESGAAGNGRQRECTERAAGIGATVINCKPGAPSFRAASRRRQVRRREA